MDGSRGGTAIENQLLYAFKAFLADLPRPFPRFFAIANTSFPINIFSAFWQPFSESISVPF
jgi:hypothetical protein